MRDIRHTFKTFAARACTSAALLFALLFVLHAAAGSALAQDKTTEVQEKALKENGIERPPAVNTRPWEDLARKGRELYQERKLDAFTRIDVSATAELNDDGTLKPESVKMTWATSSDEAVVSLAQQLLTAISQSKVLGVLKDAKQVSMRLKVDDTNALINVSSAMPSAESARKLADGYSALIRLATMTKKGTREGELYEGLRFDSDDKLFTFKFEMSKERLGDIIMEMLAKKDAAAHS